MSEPLLSRWLGRKPAKRQRLAAENDTSFPVGRALTGPFEAERLDYDRERLQREALLAWRVNPLARRIVGLTSQYVVGGGIAFSCDHPGTAAFLKAFWEHPLNQVPLRLYEWCDELSRSGNLFLLLSGDAAGMTYVRVLPAMQVKEIHTRPNDLDQETGYEVMNGGGSLETVYYPAYQAGQEGKGAVMLHYTINRVAGCEWGESDLGPILKWLGRYAGWLEDRARLNRFRTAFLYVVHGRFNSEAERRTRQAALNVAPPTPGSILVTDDGESWEVLNPELASDEAGSDGLALKKMVCAGAGIPLHFLAEPESATRTTAEAAGGPTYRYFEQRQRAFLWLLRDLLQAVVERRSQVDRRVSRKAEIHLNGADISARDNISLAMAANNMLTVLRELRDRCLIDDAEMLRLAYRFCGETTDIAEMLTRGEKAAATSSGGKTASTSQPLKVDTANGEIKEAQIDEA